MRTARPVTDSDYYSMPTLFKMDDFAECMSESHGTYCMADFVLKPDSSKLYNMIKSSEIVDFIARQKYNPFVSVATPTRCAAHVNSCLYLFCVTRQVLHLCILFS
ncbi:hypothetical protein ACJJTC_004862 [Scirpophaga incertulas]